MTERPERPLPLRSAIAAWKRRLLPRRDRGSAEVFRAFETAFGDGSRSRPVSFRRGVLLVEVESAAHFHELRNFARRASVERLNRAIGSPLVTEVSFRLASPPSPAGMPH